MLYRPNYCANCGEKVERVEWGVFTSRRFCGICETEFKGHDLLTRAIVAAGALVGVLGVGAFLSSGSSPEPIVARQASRLVDRPVKSDQEPKVTANSLPPAKTPEIVAPAQVLSAAKPPSVKAEIADAQYFCGAETKKGTPCSRRVKGNIRCYQHTGMPAMTSPDRSKISKDN